VLNARFAKPLDSEMILGAAQQTSKVLIVEEGVLRGGFCSSVLDLLNRSGLKGVKAECIGLPDQFIEHGSPEIFRARYDLDAAGITRRIKTAFPELLKKPLTANP
jgi:1-deoxy-D-xylulose-5-phosphate synthase